VPSRMPRHDIAERHQEANATLPTEVPAEQSGVQIAPNNRRASVTGAVPPKLSIPLSREMYTAAITAVAIGAHTILQYATHVSKWIALAPLFLALIVGGFPILATLGRKLWAREFGSDLLAGISILSAVLLEQYLVAAIIVLMLSGGSALEQFATRKASSVLDALAKRMPQVAHRKCGVHIEDVSLDLVTIGDQLVVFPHETCPVDGVVVEGRGVMDESYLTGEPFEISKTPGSQVLSGAINGDMALTVRAEKRAVDSRYAKIMQVMEQTQQKRPQLRRIGDTLGTWYTPIAVILAAAAWIWTGDATRFLAVVVIATPCPLILAIPVAVIGAISLSAKHAIIIKNPAALEQIATCRTLIFDKTGTLTYGKPVVTDILCAPGISRETLLQLSASLEQFSKHPLAGAILQAAHDRKIALSDVTEVRENPGEGLEGIVEGTPVRITGRGKVDSSLYALPPVESGLECLVFAGGEYAGAFRFHDTPRHDTKPFVHHLSPRHQISRVMLVSGDRETEVRYLAGQVGIREIHASQTPEQKVQLVEQETRQARTLFIGDGINDAPALIAATVGVAFGPNSDITSEAADAVILTPSLAKVDELIHISHRMRSIALQSAIGGMVVSIFGMIAAAAGYLQPIEGAILQEVIDLAAVVNAVRVALPSEELADF
jgi:heavy metal translocating P-type ATPase